MCSIGNRYAYYGFSILYVSIWYVEEVQILLSRKYRYAYYGFSILYARYDMLKKFKFSWIEGIGMHTVVSVYYMWVYDMLKKFKFSWVEGIGLHTMVSVYYM